MKPKLLRANQIRSQASLLLNLEMLMFFKFLLFKLSLLNRSIRSEKDKASLIAENQGLQAAVESTIKVQVHFVTSGSR
jgi:hypothetical protein